MRVIIFFAAILLIMSCKNQGLKNQEDVNISKINDFLTIEIKARVLEDDIFEIYYAENLENTYMPEERVQANVRGSNEFQEIIFRFPDRVYPMKLRIDLGLNKNETDIEIEEIRLSTGDKNVKLSTEEIVQRFRLNKYISYSQETNSFRRKTINGIYDPIMLSGSLAKEVTDIFSE